MSRRGKNINVFLMDGDANGLIKATISNWIGVAYKIPRNKLSSCKDVEHLSQSSVYFLFGGMNNFAGNPVYIGQAGIRKNGGGILTRLQEHDKNPDKAYWTDAVVFTTSNNSLGQTELSYLENRFCNMALEAKRYKVQNANDPTPGNITEEKESELEEFTDYAELILGVLGYKVFEKETDDLRANEDIVTQDIIRKSDDTSKTEKNIVIPELPNKELKVSQFIQEAMKRLSESGYTFSDEQIALLCDKNWSKKHFNTNNSFFTIHNDNDSKNLYDTRGRARYLKTVYSFGKFRVHITKETFEKDHNKEFFIRWYEDLGTPKCTDRVYSLPELPDESLPVGMFIRTAMSNLAISGFNIDEILEDICSLDYSKKTFGTYLPFAIYDDGFATEKIKDSNSRSRYYQEPIDFGGKKIFLNAQLTERSKHKEKFVSWYESLMRRYSL